MHENLHSTHYLFFPNKTKVSVVCPAVEPKVAAVYGLYRVSDQCELHAPGMSTIANRQNTFVRTQEDLLFKINLDLSNRPEVIKIRRLHKHSYTEDRNQHKFNPYYLYIVLIVVAIILCVVGLVCCRKYFRKAVERQTGSEGIRHVSVTSSKMA